MGRHQDGSRSLATIARSRYRSLITVGLLAVVLLLGGMLLPAAQGGRGVGVQQVCAQGACCTCPPSPCIGPGGCFVQCDAAPPGNNPGPTPPPVPTPPGGGDPTPPPGGGGPTPPPPPGNTPPPPTPPPGLAPGAGYYRVACDANTPDCRPYGSVLTWWCYTGGACYVVSSRCANAGECVPVTPTPRPTSPPPPDPTWPCDTPPEVSGGVIVQPCPRWPGWDLLVEVRIPPAEVLRNPWPRALVGLPTRFWFAGGADVERFSDAVALPCTVDYGATYTDANLPTCPAPTGPAGAGTRVNYQLGVAWRRWKSSTGPIFGFQPPYEVGWTVPERAWNGGPRQAFGYYLEHTFETTSWGLEANGPDWNPVCQTRDCGCDARVQGWNREAYQVGVQTWWYPQYTFRYDELYCSRRERLPCYCFPHEPVWDPTRQGCNNPPAGCAGWWGSIEECTEYRWRRVTEPWATYNLTLLGYQGVLPWYLVRQAGATPGGAPCGSYGPTGGAVAVPVIEVQSVAP